MEEKVYTETAMNWVVKHLFDLLIKGAPDKTSKEYLEFSKKNIFDVVDVVEWLKKK